MVKNKVLVVGGERDAPQVEVEINCKIREIVSSSKYLGSCFSKGVWPQEDMEMRPGERLKPFGALKTMFDVRGKGLGVKKRLY